MLRESFLITSSKQLERNKKRKILNSGFPCSIHWDEDHQHHKRDSSSKIMDIISRLLGCGGQAADAVISLYPSKKMEDAHKLLKKFKNPSVPDIWIRLPRHKWRKFIVPVWKIQSFPLEKEFVRSSFGRDCLW